MSIRIPKGVDVDTYNAFRDIEQALEELKRRPAVGEPPDVDTLISRIEQLERKPGVDSDKDTFVGSGPQSGVGLVPSPGGTADNEAVLLENGTWGYPVRGLVRAVTKDGEVGGVQQGADIVEVLGLLNVLGPLSADVVHTRQVFESDRPLCRLTRSAAQSIPDGGAPTTIIWTVVTYDNGGMFSSAAPTRITAQVSGYYVIGANLSFTGGGAGSYRQMTITVNGTTYGHDYLSPASYVTPGATIVRYLTAGDYVEVRFVHDFGSAQNITVGTDYTPNFWVVKVA